MSETQSRPSLRILIVSFHFYPSGAIGAKRMSELARFLVGNGAAVTALCAPAVATHGDSELLARVRGVEIRSLREPFQIDPLLIRLNALARRLSLKLVPWATRRPGGSSSAPPSRPEVHHESPWHRLKRYANSLIGLYDDSKAWTLRAMVETARLRLFNRYDLIISSGPPFSQHLAALLARCLFKAPWVIDYRDPWCGNISAAHHAASKSGFQMALERYTERFCLQFAAAVVVASPGIARQLHENHRYSPDRITTILNGYDGPATSTPAAPGVLRLLYAGTLYLGRNPLPLFEAIADLVAEAPVERHKIRFLLVGSCQRWGDIDLRQWLVDRSLQDVIDIRSSVRSSELSDLYQQSNVLVTFAQGQPDQIPGKIYEYVAHGRDMLVLTEPQSDTAWLCREAGIGRVVDPSSRASLRDALRQLYQSHVVDQEPYRIPQDSVRRFSRDHGLARYAAVMYRAMDPRFAEESTHGEAN